MITISNNIVTITDDAGNKLQEHEIGSPQAFSILSDLWLRSGWDTKYVYSFTWLGRPIIQLPEDMFRLQEVIYSLKPDVIIETGIAHGGSLIFHASLCRAMQQGRVIGVDIEIRPHNRKAIEEHELFEHISLIEGSSIDQKIVEAVKEQVSPDEKTLVILDSNHTKEHVLAELRTYSEIVSIGSYIVACDGIMEKLVGAPRSEKDWKWNNPKTAVKEFLTANDKFVLEEPRFPFNEGAITKRVTYWPDSFLKRIR
jgi:cephalosporin hydroxylase